MKFIMTNDVESHSFETNNLDSTIDVRIENEAMPRLLKVHKKYGVKATFFFVATFARSNPNIVRMVVKDGHEVGCHGFDDGNPKLNDLARGWSSAVLYFNRHHHQFCIWNVRF